MKSFVNVYKHRLVKSQHAVKWFLMGNNVPVFYIIEFIKDVNTNDGIMKLVKFNGKVELADPSNDLAVVIAQCDVGNSALEDLFYWRDKFWVRAVTDMSNNTYYRNKSYVLYEVNVDDEESLFKSVNFEKFWGK